VSINELARMVIDISGKDLTIQNIEGQAFIDKYGFSCPEGVRGRNSDNRLFKEKMRWSVSQPLITGLEKTYRWINEQVNNKKH
jgi:GDP-D-mannose 3',5'-epimerase